MNAITRMETTDRLSKIVIHHDTVYLGGQVADNGDAPIGPQTENMLAKVDLMSMANSLEVRVPLLDHRVVELAFQIPGPEKLRGGVTKRVLKEAFKELLPPGHTEQPKSGFEVPISRWLRTDLSFMVDRYLSEERIRDQGLFDFDTVDTLGARQRHSTTDTSWMLWNLIVFQKWHESHL